MRRCDRHLRCCQVTLLLMLLNVSASFAQTPRNDGERRGLGKAQPGFAGGRAGFRPASSSTRKEAEVFLNFLFNKYGNNGIMTFEGFEHLLHSLGIGNVTALDHDIKQHHTETGFVEFHPDHNHIGTDKHAHNHDHGHDHGSHDRQSDHDHVGRDYGDHFHGNNHSDHDHGSHNHSNHDHGNHDHSTHESNEDWGHGKKDYDGHGHSSHGHNNHDHSNEHSNHDGHHSGVQQGGDFDDYYEAFGFDFENAAQQPAGDEEADDVYEYLGFDFEHQSDTTEMEGKEKSPPCKNESETADSTARVRRAPPNQDGYIDQTKCLTAQEILTAYHIRYKLGITQGDFVNLCPAIIYQIDEHTCKGPLGPQGKAPTHSIFDIQPKVWGYALLAVLVISLVGLLAVAIVPLMQKVFYNYLIQFLVALAIGSLTGDALLHLLPHSISGGHGDGHSHNEEGVFRGMVVLLGIYLFFTLERLMDYLTQRRQRRLTRKKSRKVYATPTENIGEKLSHYQLAGRSVEDIIIMTKLNPDTDVPKLMEGEGEGEVEVEEGKHHGHSHGDGKLPSSITSVAWMVIMGDGLHNFTDGLAIGAAFANSITGGLSTSVAVFCHELPHELGDFAVLLRAGMAVKQALFYNMVSSVLCLIGALIGLLIGNIHQASLWVFALTAGIFIYISLVDMLPEISNPIVAEGESRCAYFTVQFLGITTGVAIMLVIALFEEKIQVKLDDSVF